MEINYMINSLQDKVNKIIYLCSNQAICQIKYTITKAFIYIYIYIDVYICMKCKCISD